MHAKSIYLSEKKMKNLDTFFSSLKVMLSSPGNLSDHIKESFINILVQNFRIKGVNILNQSLLSLYSYCATSGIVVDIGERLEIVPVTDGELPMIYYNVAFCFT